MKSNWLSKYKDGGIKKAFNPTLAEDSKFQQWYKYNTLERQANIPYDDKQVYDYLSFYKNNEYKNPDYGIDKHFPDTYKRPNHPTFSNESIYSTPENPGGSWKGEKFNPKGKFKYDVGGKMQEYQPNFNNSFISLPKDYVGDGYNSDNWKSPSWGGQFVDGGEVSAQDFMSSYIQSPIYKQRLVSSKYKNPNEQITQRLDNVQNSNITFQKDYPSVLKQLWNEVSSTPYTTKQIGSNATGKNIVIDNQQAKLNHISPEEVAAHELGHAELRSNVPFKTDHGIDYKPLLNKYDIDQLISRQNKSVDSHDKNSVEAKSDLNSLRYIFQENGINPLKPINQKSLNIIRDRGVNNEVIKRTSKNYTDKNLLWLLNNIAENKQQTPQSYENIPSAKDGKQLQLLDNLINFTNYNTKQPNGWLEQYK